MAADALTAFLHRDFQRSHEALLTLSSDTSLAAPPISPLTSTNINVHNPPHVPNVDDPRIEHNTLVAQFYDNPSHSTVDSILLFAARFISSEKRPISVTDLFRCIAVDPSIVKALHTQVGPVVLYNIAVIAYHQHHLDAALVVTDVLFDQVEALDEWLALASCFLLADIRLRLDDVPAAASAIAYADKLLSSFTRISANAPNYDLSTDSPQIDRHSIAAVLPELSPPWSGRNVAILLRPTSHDHAKFCIHLYNARLSVATDTVDVGRTIRKEAKQAILAADDAQNRPTSAALLIKARAEPSHLNGLRILASIVSQCPHHTLSKVRPLALNSLGVLHHRLGRHALALCYFQRARRAFDDLLSHPRDGRHFLGSHNHKVICYEKSSNADAAVVSEDDSVDNISERMTKDCPQIPLSIFNSVRDTHVAYNLALQYMKVSEFTPALNLFSKCARADSAFAKRSPLLWIRMAECCVGTEYAGRQSHSSLSFEGRGRSRRMVMRTSDTPDVAIMQYAVYCARAALRILDEGRESSEHTRSLGKRITDAGDEVARPFSRPSSPPLKAPADNDRDLRGAAWTLIAYASLVFDAQGVLDACSRLQQLYPKSEHERWTLAQLYSAEAFCILRRPAEAVKRLAPLLSASVPLESDVREAAYVNMALAHACTGDLSTASRAARVALKMYSAGSKRHRYIRKQAMFVASYIFLRNGDTEAARDALRFVHNPSVE